GCQALARVPLSIGGRGAPGRGGRTGLRMKDVDDKGDRIWGLAERLIDPFADTEREVLPREALSFILFFARQAKLPFVMLLVIGGLSGAVDAGLYWAVGWLIDILDASSPA